MQTVAVLDFETTGLSPSRGDRATEIAVILLRNGEIVDRYQSLMNAGRHIPSQLVSLTEITNDMIADAPAASKVMSEAARPSRQIGLNVIGASRYFIQLISSHGGGHHSFPAPRMRLAPPAARAVLRNAAQGFKHRSPLTRQTRVGTTATMAMLHCHQFVDQHRA